MKNKWNPVVSIVVNECQVSVNDTESKDEDIYIKVVETESKTEIKTGQSGFILN